VIWPLVASALLSITAGEGIPAVTITQDGLDAISDKCRLSRSYLIARGAGSLEFSPAVNADYSAVDCVLQSVRTTYYPNEKFGFVGNEAFETKAK